jgi:hypothetical protein
VAAFVRSPAAPALTPPVLTVLGVPGRLTFRSPKHQVRCTALGSGLRHEEHLRGTGIGARRNAKALWNFAVRRCVTEVTQISNP